MDISPGDDKFLRIEQVTEIVSLGETKIRELIKAGSFPRPYTIHGIARKLWSYREIQEWIAEVKDGLLGERESI